MSELEEKLSALMGDPAMMQKIMALAQSLESNEPQAQQPQQVQQTAKPPENPFGGLDPSMLQKLTGFAQKSRIDKQQQALLHALIPYLSGKRIARLERAMQAAKMAGFATSLLGR